MMDARVRIIVHEQPGGQLIATVKLSSDRTLRSCGGAVAAGDAHRACLRAAAVAHMRNWLKLIRFTGEVEVVDDIGDATTEPGMTIDIPKGSGR